MKKLLLLPLLALVLSGCDTVNTVERANPEMTPDYVAAKKVVTDPSLADIVSIENVIQSTVSGNLLKIQVELKNKTNSYHRFLYRFQWFDKDGMQVTRAAPPWRTSQVEGRETVYVSGVSPSPNAADFRLELLDSLNPTSGGVGGTSSNPRARTPGK
ncbi:MAG: YcfL family protein [Puniceicoccales bacterium]